MEDVKWLEIAINTSADQLDAVTAKLAANGMDSIVLEEEGEFRQFLEQNRQYWDYVDDELLDASQEFYEKHSSLYGIEELL